MTILNNREVREIKEYNKKLAKFFDIPVQKFRIKIVTKKEINKLIGKNYDWMISIVKGNNIYLLSREEIKEDFFETLKHDLVHIYVHKKFPGTAGFIDEGFAEYFSRPYKKDWQRKLLEQDADIIQFMAGMKKRYLSAFSIVYFLMKRFGKAKVFQLASQLKPFNKMDVKEADELFSFIIGFGLTEFEKQWRKFIKNEST